MSKKLFLFLGALLLPAMVIVGIGTLLPKSYNISYEVNIQKQPSKVLENISNLQKWDKWFVFNSTNSDINISSNKLNIITAKKKIIEISNLMIDDNKVSFVMRANKYVVNGSFVVEKKHTYSNVKGFFYGDIDAFLIGGYMKIFIQSSLEYILQSSLEHLKTIK